MDPPDGGRTSRREFLKAAAGGAMLAVCPGLALSGCRPALSEKLSVEPCTVRGDEPFVVRLRDLSAGERVVLTAAFDDATGGEWSSTAVFEADGDGRVDTSEQAPAEGSYGVRDPMGLVWSALGPGGGYLPPGRSSPIRIGSEVDGERATARVERHASADGVEETEVREDGLAGTLFSPAGGDPRPGVLVLGGSEGGLSPFSEREAALLASRGYAALALAYFRGGSPWGRSLPGSLPETLTNVPLEYFGRALGWLAQRGGVDGGRLGALGHSRGGELALLLGATYPEVGAVVSYVGGGAVAPSPEGDEPAWTYEGEPLPYLPFTDDPSSITDEELARAAIPVEKIGGPVLLIGTGDDAVWPSARFARATHDRLARADRPHEDELAVYPEAGHAITAPYVPVAGGDRFGGTPEANARANEDSWRKATALLDRGLKGGEGPE